MSINFELLDLRAFLAVFDHASFNKAAELLNRSQPALSLRIGGPDARVGVPSLEHSTRHVVPTSAGRRIELKARCSTSSTRRCCRSAAPASGRAAKSRSHRSRPQ
jgi:DNA-binding transcriptional LysR family regulator